MAVKLLGQPASVLATEKFEKTYFSPERLIRISAYQTGEPYFGTSGYNRFDAPGARAGHPQYGVCYFGTHLEVAMAESILHDEVPVDGSFQLAPSQIDRYALYFEGKPLHLLDLTGPLLKRIGGSAKLAGTADYALTQSWSRAVHDNPAAYDGFLYMSRHHNTRRAVALFDRAAYKIRLASYAKLSGARGFRLAIKNFNIVLI